MEDKWTSVGATSSLPQSEWVSLLGLGLVTKDRKPQIRVAQIQTFPPFLCKNSRARQSGVRDPRPFPLCSTNLSIWPSPQCSKWLLKCQTSCLYYSQQGRKRDEEGNALFPAEGILEECHFSLVVLKPREGPPGPRRPTGWTLLLPGLAPAWDGVWERERCRYLCLFHPGSSCSHPWNSTAVCRCQDATCTGSPATL